MADIEAGDIARPKTSSPALVAYVRAIGLRKGDVQVLSLSGPGGADLGRNQAAPLDADKAQYMLFTGKRLTASAWPTGTYKAAYSVQRGGRTVLTENFDFVLK